MQIQADYQPELQLLQAFSSISLDEMDEVRLLNRVDQKYALHLLQLPALLRHLSTHYRILELDGQRCFRYHTTYFDTPDFLLYQAHHKGMSNRVKVRCRRYVDSGLCYFEIKQKQMGIRTHKLRYALPTPLNALDQKARDALKQQYQRLPLQELNISLYNTFSRITLVSKSLQERCTLDLNLKFRSADGREAMAEDLVIVEVKQARMNPLSPVLQALRKERIFSCSFSKYIYGIIHTQPGLKYNAFKPLLHRLEKIKHRFAPMLHPVIP